MVVVVEAALVEVLADPLLEVDAMKKISMTIVALSLIGALAGCGDTTRQSRLGAAPVVQPLTDLPQVSAPAGIDLDAARAANGDVITLAKGMSFASRGNDFALLGGEMSFDQQQLAYRILDGSGGWSTYFEMPDEPPLAQEIQREPTPLWRLSGIVISESVTALMEVGPGQTLEIRPGMRIPNTPWTVISIDEEKAVLRREGNVEPKEFEVRLESPMNMPGTTGGGGGGGERGGRDDRGGRGGRGGGDGRGQDLEP